MLIPALLFVIFASGFLNPRANLAGNQVLRATADGPLLDRCPASVDLVGAVVADLPEAWVVELAP